jgi:diguanylate cyclase (GGDEF)-like protein/PAS domain S-box-containing protein
MRGDGRDPQEQVPFASVVADAAEPMITVDLDGLVTTWNRAAERVLGWPADQAVGRPIGKFLALPARFPQLRRRIEGGETQVVVTAEWIRRDGTRIVTSDALSPIRSADGVVIGVAGICRDMTAEHSVAESEARLRGTLDGLMEGVVVVGADLRVRTMNTAAERILGYAVDGLQSLVSAGEFVTYEEDGSVRPPEQRAIVRAFATGGSTVDAITGWRRPDGHLIVLRASVQARMAGDRVDSVLLAFTDVTAERAAEQEVRTVNARFAALVEHSSDLACLLDATGVITYASPASVAVFGLEPREAEGKGVGDLVHPDDLKQVLTENQALRARGGGSVSFDCRVRHTDGTWRRVEVMATDRLDDPDVGGIIANIRDVTERAEAAAQLAWQAFHDPLTGLANRALLLDRVSQALSRQARSGNEVALLYVDLDRFKLVNDSLGHAVGDVMLRIIAERLTRCVRQTDTVSRMGGDEFVILVDDLARRADAEVLADRMLASLEPPLEIRGEELSIGASIGIAYADHHTASELLRDADTALLRAKDAGKGCWKVFEESLRAAALTRLSTEQLLRGALDDGLVVFYQPIVDLTTGAVTGAEALIRVRCPGGLMPPAEFLAVAEDTGLIVTIGAGVLDAACGQLAAWRRADPLAAPQRISVNVATRQLMSSKFAATVDSTLRRHDLNPSDLALELTETVLLGADRATADTLEQLRRWGVALIIDDFGTGYSSLSYLKRFAVSEIKVDREFVDGLGVDPGDTEIVKAVVTLGHALGLAVTAEGVETPEQRDLLRSLGCDRAQGYLFAPPQPPEQLCFQGYDLMRS